MAAMSMMLIACHSSMVYVLNELKTLLNSEEGQKMTATHHQGQMTPDFADKLRGAGCDIHLPLTDENTLPKVAQLYVSSVTGSSMISPSKRLNRYSHHCHTRGSLGYAS